MTAVIEERAPLDLSETAKIPLTRMARVELRKMADTRSGRWLLIAIVALTAAIVTIFFLTAEESDRTFMNFMGVTGTPQGFLLPVLGILLVTSEWGQRTALVTFTLTPVRGRVLTAKVIAALVFGMAALLVAVAIGSLATVVGGAPDAWQGVGIDEFGKLALLQATGVVQGLAFGLVLLNSAGAIVAFFVLPIVLNLVAGFWSAMRDVQPWIDLAYAQQPLFSGSPMNGDQWFHLASATAVWVLLPLVIGVVRVLRREVK
jgi:ABC-2 type transport system permease protein